MASSDNVTETSREVVKRFYEYLCAGDFPGVLSCMNREIEIHEPECLPYGGVYRGVEEVMALFSEAAKFLDVRVFHIDTIIADGDHVVGMLRTAVGTGEPLAVAEESIVRDGKISRVRVFQWNPVLVINAAKADRKIRK